MGNFGADVLSDAYFSAAFITFILPGRAYQDSTTSDRHIMALIPCGEDDAVVVNTFTDDAYASPLSQDSFMSVMKTVDLLQEYPDHDDRRHRRATNVVFVYYSPHTDSLIQYTNTQV